MPLIIMQNSYHKMGEVTFLKAYILNSVETVTQEEKGLEKLSDWLFAKSIIDEVTVFKDPDRFLLKVEEERPELVFIRLDGIIPGIKLGKIIKMMDLDIRIIYLAEQEDYALDAYEMGATGYLLCPVDKRKFNKLLAAINKN